jgi:rhamnogalacturonan endolyase
MIVNFTYNGDASPPTAPGTYAVTATIVDPDYVGSATGELLIAVNVISRHAPSMNGTLSGSFQMLLAENLSLNGGATVTGDVVVPALRHG